VSVRPSVCPSARLIHRLLQQHAAGLLLSAVLAEDIDRQRWAASSDGAAAARRSAANAGSVTLSAAVEG